MQRVWSWLGLNLGRRAGLVSVVGLGLTLVLGLGITRLEFATGQDSYLNPDDRVAIDNEAYQELFGGQAMVTLFTMDEGSTIVDLFTPENIGRIKALEEDLRSREGVRNVVSPVMALEFTQAVVTSPTDDPTQSVAGQALLSALEREPDEAARQRRLEESLGTLERLNAVPPEERNLENRAWVEFLLLDNSGEVRNSLRPFFPDDRHAQMVTRLVGNASNDEEGLAAERVVEATGEVELDSASILTTGAPLLIKDLNDYLKGGMMTLGGIAVAIMVVILLLLFQVRWRLLPLAVILIGVVWAFGLAGYLGIPLSVVTIAGLPVLLGVGIDYAIQMHARVEEEVIVDRSDHPIQETARNLGPALLVVTFDAVFAFLALRFARVPMLRDFGLLLAVGIAAVCICSIVVPLAVLGIREHRSPTRRGDYREGPLAKIVLFLGNLPAKAAVPLALLSIVIFVGGVIVEDRLVLQTDPIRWVNQDSDTVRGIEQLERHPEVLLTASSIVTTMSGVIEVPGTTPLPPTGDDVRRAYEVAPPDVRASTVSEDGDALNLIIRTGPSSLQERADVIDEIRETADPPSGVSATPAGLAVVGAGLLENLEANRILLTYLALAFVFAFLTVRLKSVVRALLSMVPVLIAVGAASLVSYAAGFELSPMTAVGGPLVIAACTEFTSLILLRFLEERRRGLDPKEAVDATATRTGRAFIVSALTAIVGVAVIAFSSLPLLRDFGMIVAMNVTVALLSALVVLPPMLVWADQRGWVSKGMLARAEPQRPAQGRFVPQPAPGGGS